MDEKKKGSEGREGEQRFLSLDDFGGMNSFQDFEKAYGKVLAKANQIEGSTRAKRELGRVLMRQRGKEEMLGSSITEEEEGGVEEESGNGALYPLRVKRGKDMMSFIFGRHASLDVKMHAVYARLFIGLSLKDVTKTFGKSESTISKWVSKYQKDGLDGLVRKSSETSVQARNLILEHHLQWIKEFVLANPLSYLSEIQGAFQKTFLKSASEQFLGRCRD